MNIQHSSRTDQWFTPQDIINRATYVLQGIDFDPASSIAANKRIKAITILTEKSLETPWPLQQSIFLNPPGGKSGNNSNTALFWKKLMEYRASGSLKHAIFLAFSLEALQTTQGKGCPSLGDYTFCVPKQRIRFLNEDGSIGKAPSHSNVIAYIPGSVDRTKEFIAGFCSLGTIIHEAGVVNRGGL